METVYRSGWVVKAPFTTNCHYVKFPKTIDKVIKLIKNAPEHQVVGFNQIPYLMVQPCMHNRKEYKVVMLNHHPIYVSSLSNSNKRSKSGICKAFGGEGNDKQELLAFCAAQLTELKNNCPSAITDGLFRVDVFQNFDGTMVVNEFESLEAAHFGTPGQEIKVSDFLFRYWLLKIKNLFETNFKIASENFQSHFTTLQNSELVFDDIINEGSQVYSRSNTTGSDSDESDIEEEESESN